MNKDQKANPGDTHSRPLESWAQELHRTLPPLGTISLDLHRRIRNAPEPTPQELEFWSTLPERTMPTKQDVENALNEIRDIRTTHPDDFPKAPVIEFRASAKKSDGPSM